MLTLAMCVSAGADHRRCCFLTLCLENVSISVSGPVARVVDSLDLRTKLCGVGETLFGMVSSQKMHAAVQY